MLSYLKSRISINKITLSFILLIGILTVSNLYYQLSLGGFLFYSVAEVSSNWALLLFIVLFALSFLICHYILARFVDPLIQRIKKSFITSTYRIVKTTQYALLALLIAITIQMVLFTQYSAAFFTAIACISFSTAAFIIGYLSIKFFSWYKSNHNFVILICGITFTLLAIGLVAVVIIVGGNLLLEKRINGTVYPLSKEPSSPEKREIDSAKESRLWNIVIMPSRLAFILYWITNVLLLRNYSAKVGRTKFWAIVSLPLIGFVVVNLIVILSTLIIGTSPFGLLFLTVTRIIIVFVILVSGIFFAIMFLTMGKTMKNAGQSHIQDYLRCSAYGIIIFVLSLTIHLGSLLFPPTVLLPWAFAGFASFLVSFGFYSLAISVSQDIKLRKSIKNFVISESTLFDSIGTAEMQVRLEQQVSKIVREQEEEMEKHTEIKPSLTEEDMKSYLSEVIQEVKKSRK